MSWISRRWAGWFDGQDDYVQLPGASFDLDKMTIVAIFKANDVTNLGRIFQRASATWGLHVDSGKLYFYVDTSEDGGSWKAVATPIEAGQTYCGVGVYDGSEMRLYVDGVMLSSLVQNGLVDDGGADAWIGSSQNAQFFYGDIYCVMIWNRALTDDEIAKLNEDPFDPNNVPKDGLVGWWDFNKADWSNGILPDLSGNGNDGQMYGVVQRDVLVKRGKGELPKWDLLYSWVCDGIDDYVEADFNGWMFKKSISFNIWDRPYAGDYYYCNVKDYAKGVGYYDSNKDAWRVDSGQKGYFFEREIVYDENVYGRGVWFYVNGVQVDDNSQDVPLFRFEVEDVNTGKIVFSYDYKANQFPKDSFSGIKTAGFGFMPYGHYKVRLFSYGNVGFWIKNVSPEGWHASLVYWDDGFIYRHYPQLKFRLYREDGSYDFTFYVRNLDIHKVENIMVGWSNFDKKYVAYLNGVKWTEVDSISDLDVRTSATKVSIGAKAIGSVSNRYVGEIISIVIFDRLLNESEVQKIYDKEFVLDGLVHWWVVDEDGSLVDLVTGKSYQIQGNPYIRRLYDEEGRLNSGTGVVVFDIIKDGRGQ